MADDSRKRGQPDRSTINMKEIYERKYWKKKFRVSDQALQVQCVQWVSQQPRLKLT
jgi:hypothetical protein